MSNNNWEGDRDLDEYKGQDWRGSVFSGKYGHDQKYVGSNDYGGSPNRNNSNYTGGYSRKNNSSHGKRNGTLILLIIVLVVGGVLFVNDFDITSVTQEINEKVNDFDITSVTQEINEKVNDFDVTSVTQEINEKVNDFDVTSVTQEINEKVNDFDVTSVTQEINENVWKSGDTLFQEITSKTNSHDPRTIEKLVHEYTNDERKKFGLMELGYDNKLANIARGHSLDMAFYNFFEHDNLDGMDPTDRAKILGYSCTKTYGNYYTDGISENIFQHNLYNSINYVNGIPVSYDWNTNDQIAKDVVNGWMDSPGHRANILEPNYDKEGIGVSISDDDKVLVTQNFC
jgi:uncharacterized protein YkwD